jgi:hypothetical protein
MLAVALDRAGIEPVVCEASAGFVNRRSANVRGMPRRSMSSGPAP